MGAFLAKLFSGGLVGSLERVALEAISTKQETAEAQALMIKTLDPNGKMRRDLSRFACKAYGFYLVTTVILIFMHSFGIGDTVNSKAAIEAMSALFLPITTSWGVIVSASFGVNGVNTLKGKP